MEQASGPKTLSVLEEERPPEVQGGEGEGRPRLRHEPAEQGVCGPAHGPEGSGAGPVREAQGPSVTLVF